MTDPQQPEPLHLADHVRFCVAGDQVILLDLKRNRYLGLDHRQWERALAPPAADAPAHSPLRPPDASVPALRASLRRRRLLASVPTHVRAPLSLAAPTRSFEPLSPARLPPFAIADLLRFITATVVAATWLRFRSLHAIERSVERCHRTRVSTNLDAPAHLAQALSVFDRLRPLTFTSRDKCLFDSLALTIFLARQGIPSSWVIGVSTRPFKAHSWVQQGEQVLNDLHERVSRFTPLVVV